MPHIYALPKKKKKKTQIAEVTLCKDMLVTLLKAKLAFFTHSMSVLPPRTELAEDRSLLSMAWPILLNLYTRSCKYPATFYFIA